MRKGAESKFDGSITNLGDYRIPILEGIGGGKNRLPCVAALIRAI